MCQRQRLERATKYERVLNRLRARYSDYYEVGKAGKASKLIAKCKLLATPLWRHRHAKRQAQYNAAFSGSY